MHELVTYQESWIAGVALYIYPTSVLLVSQFVCILTILFTLYIHSMTVPHGRLEQFNELPFNYYESDNIAGKHTKSIGLASI